MPMPAEVAVAWREVRKTFDDGHVALGGVSLEVRRGEFLAILGTSGSGKTTLLKLVNRLIDPTAGVVLVGGKPTTEWDPIALRRSMGYVIQEAGLMPHLTILANVGLVPRLKGAKRADREESARRCLVLVGIDPDAMGGRFPHQLSGGQRQRVGVARALAAEPDLILMDEPFGALDPITRREIQDEFRSLQRDLGKTVILVTHDLREACRMADRLALVDGGMLVQVGSPADFLDRPANDFVRSFFQDARAVRPIDGEAPALNSALMDFLKLAYAQRGELLDFTAAHLDLVGEAILLAVAIGVPLGIASSRSRVAERAILVMANVLQTIPSLALLGVLLILFRGQIGKPPALAALVIYSLLPIIKNTILGLKGVDRGVAEAALGMGMTPIQRLTLVELPLAVPVLLGGVRVAAVASVGMATIAAAIGAKGLGSYIYRGISLSDPRLILLGSIPAALLALACDAALGELERYLDPTRPRRSKLRGALTIATTAALVGLGLYGAWGRGGGVSRAQTVVIGSKDSAEPVILGHMLADLVEAHTPLKADRRLNLGGSLICYNALKQGGLDAYVEYTGTALTTILKQPLDKDPARVRATVQRLLIPEGIDSMAPIGFENTFAILMRRKHAEELGVRTVSDLARLAGTIRAGFGPEFMNRPDGYPGMVQAYGLDLAISPVEMDRNLLYNAIARGTLDVGAGDSTDGRVAELDLVQLRDDRLYFPPYEAVTLARSEILARHPKLREAFSRLAGKIDAPTMRRLNHEVDGLKRDPAEVALEFLGSAGLLGP